MERRTAIKQMFILAGGMLIASSCVNDGNKASIALSNVDFSKSDEELLAQLVEAIIPETDTPGGRSLNLHLFVMKMVDDCHSPEEQAAFVNGLRVARKVKDKSNEEILSYIKSLSQDDTFSVILKQRTIMGYLNSEYVMKNKLIYELVPGRYNGEMKIKA